MLQLGLEDSKIFHYLSGKPESKSNSSIQWIRILFVQAFCKQDY